MRFQKLDLNLLVALDTLLAECSITRAAELLHMSASATSSALTRLREYFDDELLVQVGRKMERTPLADALRDDVRDVLARIDATITTRAEFIPGESEREFRLFVSDYTIATLVPHVLALAAQRAPRVRFTLLPQSENHYRALARGEADLLIFPDEYCSSDHPRELLFSDTFVCAVWSDSRLAQRPSLSFEDYLEADHVVMRPLGGVPMASFEAWFALRYGSGRRIAVTTYTFESAAHLVVGTERIATMHCRLARVMQRMLPLKLLPLPGAAPEIQQMAQWHKYRTNDNGLRWLRSLMAEAAPLMDQEFLLQRAVQG